jgi:acyl carrier protein
MDVKDKVFSIVVEQLDIQKDTLDTNKTLEQLGADSVDQVEIIMKLEEAFNTEISDTDAEKLETLGDYIDYLSS